MILSILTPSVPSRLYSWQLANLSKTLAQQIGERPVEHLILLDNKRRTIGGKRDALLRAARGEYVAFVDDDDFVYDQYVDKLLAAAVSRPDVITFNQWAVINGLGGQVEFRLGHPNDPWNPEGITRRNAWHVCAWRRALAIQSHFPDNSYGEDWGFAARLCALPGLREVHIPEILHRYEHTTAGTEAPPP